MGFLTKTKTKTKTYNKIKERKMRKILSLTVAVLTALMGMTSCNGSDNEPQEIYVPVSTGAYILNEGNEGNNIEGSLTYYGYASGKASQYVYHAKNGGSLGVTANDAIIWGSNLYIVGSHEKTIFVADRSTVAKKVNISTGNYTPRHITCNGGYVYVSTYDNKVLAIDTLSMSITKEYDCGNYSEGIASIGKYIITADSNKGMGANGASVTVIDTDKNEVKKYQNSNIVNPTQILAFVDQTSYLHILYLDAGTYDENKTQSGQTIYELTKDGSSKKLVEATLATLDSYGRLYAINAPVNSSAQPTYKVIDLYTGIPRTFTLGSEIEWPAAIKADPVANAIVITSYSKVNGKIEYTAPGYGILYTTEGSQVRKFDAGIGPTSICFNIGYEKFIY